MPAVFQLARLRELLARPSPRRSPAFTQASYLLLVVVVQIGVLLAIAAILLRPWWLVTRHRCELCRSRTPRRGHRCRFCGAGLEPRADHGTRIEVHADHR